ncbi:TMV resistance protein N-like [Dorcoceras hygrometricum]|uniref:TMV resistance protein N-like n=1 Tax=Dorcoceras hygrometricum TaxID=472368 RepID=A0A2Z7C1W1_9LAMI|nr:TMV resistance protein N-like [Dorcoceras hygrometricum]
MLATADCIFCLALRLIHIFFTTETVSTAGLHVSNSDHVSISVHASNLLLNKEMASSLISSSHHIDFDSVFGIDDTGLVQMFESRAFSASRVLTENTVHRYVTINEKVGMEETADAPRVKKTPEKKTVSMKRPVGDGEEAPVVKKKRTTKGKPVVIAQEAVPFVLATRDSERLFETASDSEDDMDPDVGTQALPEVRETDVVLETDDVSGTAIGSDVGNQQLQIDADDSRADATINSFISDPDEEMEPVVEEQSAEDILM